MRLFGEIDKKNSLANNFEPIETLIDQYILCIRRLILRNDYISFYHNFKSLFKKNKIERKYLLTRKISEIYKKVEHNLSASLIRYNQHDIFLITYE